MNFADMVWRANVNSQDSSDAMAVNLPLEVISNLFFEITSDHDKGWVYDYEIPNAEKNITYSSP